MLTSLIVSVCLRSDSSEAIWNLSLGVIGLLFFSQVTARGLVISSISVMVSPSTVSVSCSGVLIAHGPSEK